MTSDDETRLRRMGVWIKHAENLSETERHLRFVCYWIAFDAAFAQFAKGGGDGMGRMARFLKRVAKGDENGDICKILRDRRRDIERICELRQTAPTFWDGRRSKVRHPSQWEGEFANIRDEERRRLRWMVRSGQHVSAVLEDLFGRLYVVRNQIFHGGSSGARSHGMTQVKAGVLLLSRLVPCFREIMRKDADWGPVPFPRLGRPDQRDLSPPWIRDE